MLPDEYEQRRVLPRHLRPAPPADPGFTFRLRPAEVEDMPSVREIYNHFVMNSTVTFETKALSLPGMRQKLETCRRFHLPFIVAEGGSGQVIGFAYVQPWSARASSRRVVEDNIYLGPAAGGRGLGRVLLVDLIERCRQAGVKRVVSIIADSKADASIHLHEALGFKRVGSMGRVAYKFGRWLGTITLELKL